MASANERKPFLLRLDPATMAALKAWAADDLRSLNGQIEFLLRRAIREADRLPGSPPAQGGNEAMSDPSQTGGRQSKPGQKNRDLAEVVGQ